MLASTPSCENYMMEVSVVIPVYNEAQAIGETIRSIRSQVPNAEILVVDDGSTDDSAKVAKEAGAYVWSHPYNIGNGAAVKTGIRLASGNKIVLMDGDGQHNPADIPKLLEASERYDMVVGARDQEGHANPFRFTANQVYNLVARYATQFPVRDLTSGFRVMDRETVTRYLYLLPNSFSYPTTLTLAYLRSGHTVFYCPIQVRKRGEGKSKIKLLRDGGRFLLILIKIITLFSPFRIFLPVSLSFFLSGLGNYAFTYFRFGRFTNMSALLLITSVIIFMIGLVSEQITQLRYDRIEKGG
jgi:glycosyltransferase involved in cell wall biosynthesis